MDPGQLIIRGAVLLGLVAAFLVVMNKVASPPDVRRATPVLAQSTPPFAPSPTPTLPPTPTVNTTPLPPQSRLCANADSPPELSETAIHGQGGGIIARVYCEGPDLKYVTYVDRYGLIQRTYLFKDGVLRVKLYHDRDGGWAVKREDFDAEGNPVPNGTYIQLPSSRYDPGRWWAGQP